MSSSGQSELVSGRAGCISVVIDGQRLTLRLSHVTTECLYCFDSGSRYVDNMLRREETMGHSTVCVCEAQNPSRHQRQHRISQEAFNKDF